MDYQYISQFEPNRLVLAKLQIQLALALENRRVGNLCEVVILLQRGGRRVPYWLNRSSNFIETAHEILSAIPALTNQVLFESRESLRARMLVDGVVPRTKSRIFATFLATNVCATPESLVEQVGLSVKTARRWLAKAEKAELLHCFSSGHELFYLNLDLLQLLIEGQVSDGVFRIMRGRELRELRGRKDWLEQSRIAVKFPDYGRRL